MRRKRSKARVLLLVSIGIGCAGAVEKFDRSAADLGFSRRSVSGARFEHTAFENRAAGSRLHVYLGGDGSPRRAQRELPPDPTPSGSLALRLMALDPAPSVYLGRPCYHGAHSAQCNPWYWTLGRYSEAVVQSLATALDSIVRERGVSEVVLIGYSGGGTLAMLIAERVPQVTEVVTVAANLDIEAWADHHGYGALSGSLNPARRPPLPRRIRQLHLVGGRDATVPAWISRRAIEAQPGARTLLYTDFTHHCCWEEIWESILARP